MNVDLGNVIRVVSVALALHPGCKCVGVICWFLPASESEQKSARQAVGVSWQKTAGRTQRCARRESSSYLLP